MGGKPFHTNITLEGRWFSLFLEDKPKPSEKRTTKHAQSSEISVVFRILAKQALERLDELDEFNELILLSCRPPLFLSCVDGERYMRSIAVATIPFGKYSLQDSVIFIKIS